MNEVATYAGVDEAALYKRNLHGKIWITLTEDLAMSAADQKELEKYTFKMYTNGYVYWDSKCVKLPSGQYVDVPFLENEIYNSSLFI